MPVETPPIGVQGQDETFRDQTEKSSCKLQAKIYIRN
jgi:hypothetical protein